MSANNLNVIVVTLAKAINAIVGLINGGGFFQSIGAFNAILALRSVDFEQALEELKGLGAQDRKALEVAFEAALDLEPAVEGKISEVVNSLEDLFLLVQDGLSIIDQAVSLVARVRALLGV